MEVVNKSSYNITAKADIFAAGIIFYELLTFNHPFQCETTYETQDAIKNKQPEIFSLDISNESKELLKLMLDKDPERRRKAKYLLERETLRI